MSRPDYCRFVKEEKQGKSLGRKCQFSVNQLNVHLIIVEYFSVGETSFSFEAIEEQSYNIQNYIISIKEAEKTDE